MPSLYSDNRKTESSPYINHFLQPDTIIPDLSNPQSWNRYSYVLGNPIRYNDPSGHCPLCIAALVASFFIFNGTSDSYQPNLSAEEAGSREASVKLGTAVYATVLSLKSPWVEAASNLFDCATGTFCDPTSWVVPGSASMYDNAIEDSSRLLPSPRPFGDQGTIVLTADELDNWGSNYGAHRGEVFIASPSDVDAFEFADLSEIERRLGRKLDDGSELLRADISDIGPYNPRVPNINSKGNLNFKPGGVTSGGLPELVINPINLKAPNPNFKIGPLRYR